ELGRGDDDRVVAAAAGDLDLGVGDLGGDRLADGVGDRAREVGRVVAHGRGYTASPRRSTTAAGHGSSISRSPRGVDARAQAMAASPVILTSSSRVTPAASRTRARTVSMRAM